MNIHQQQAVSGHLGPQGLTLPIPQCDVWRGFILRSCSASASATTWIAWRMTASNPAVRDAGCRASWHDWAWFFKWAKLGAGNFIVKVWDLWWMYGQMGLSTSSNAGQSSDWTLPTCFSWCNPQWIPHFCWPQLLNPVRSVQYLKIGLYPNW